MAFTGPLEDRMLIRELYDAYSDAAFRKDVDSYLACWAEDGVRVGNGQEVSGKSALAQQWDGFWTVLEKLTFFTQIGAIEINGTTARCRVFCREIMALKGGGYRKVVGQYDDDLVQQNGKWLFARKNYSMFLDEGKS